MDSILKIIGRVLMVGYFLCLIFQILYLVANIGLTMEHMTDKSCHKHDKFEINTTQSECNIPQQFSQYPVHRFSFQNIHNEGRRKTLGFQQKLLFNSGIENDESNLYLSNLLKNNNSKNHFSRDLYFESYGRTGNNMQITDSNQSNETTTDTWGSGMGASGFGEDSEMIDLNSGNGPIPTEAHSFKYDSAATDETYSTFTYAPATTDKTYSTFTYAPATTDETHSTFTYAPATTDKTYSAFTYAPATTDETHSTFTIGPITRERNAATVHFPNTKMVDFANVVSSDDVPYQMSNKPAQSLIRELAESSNGLRKPSFEQLEKEQESDFSFGSGDYLADNEVNPFGIRNDTVQVSEENANQVDGFNIQKGGTLNFAGEYSSGIVDFLLNVNPVGQNGDMFYCTMFSCSQKRDKNNPINKQKILHMEPILAGKSKTEGNLNNATNTTGAVLRFAFETENFTESDGDKGNSYSISNQDYLNLTTLRPLTNEYFNNLNGSYLIFNISNIQINILCHCIDSKDKHFITNNIEYFTVINSTNTDTGYLKYEYTRFTGDHNNESNSNNETSDETTAKHTENLEDLDQVHVIQNSRLFSVLRDLISRNIKIEDSSQIVTSLFELLVRTISNGQNATMCNETLSWWRQIGRNADTNSTAYVDKVTKPCINGSAYWIYQYSRLGGFAQTITLIASCFVCHSAFHNCFKPRDQWSPGYLTIATCITTVFGVLSGLAWIAALNNRSKYSFMFWISVGCYLFYLLATFIIICYQMCVHLLWQRVVDERERRLDAEAAMEYAIEASRRGATLDREAEPLLGADTRDASTTGQRPSTSTSRASRGDTLQSRDSEVQDVRNESAPVVNDSKMKDPTQEDESQPNYNTNRSTNVDQRSNDVIATKVTNSETDQYKAGDVSIDDVITKGIERTSATDVIDTGSAKEESVQDSAETASVGKDGVYQAGTVGNPLVADNARAVGNDPGAVGNARAEGNIGPVKTQRRNVAVDDPDDEAISLIEPSRVAPSRRSGFPGTHGRRNTRRERGINVESDSDDGFDEP